MQRALPGARQHLGAILASASVVVKTLCAAVLFLYLLSFAVDTSCLAVTPGYLFPPNFWIWTLATHGLMEQHLWDVAISLATVVVAGRLLEPLWGALELLIFFSVVNVSVGLLGAFAYLLTYMASFNLVYLFTIRIHGALGFLGGVLVALKQTMGDCVVLRVPQVRVSVVPMLLLGLLLLLRLATLLQSPALASYGFGLLSSWVYLRFYQRHSRGRGDMADHFAFATFFPEILQPVVGLLANLVHSLLVKVKICQKTVKRYDVGAPSSITISLPGTDPQDAERRRQLALKALNERLKRVEDQSVWPSMDDDEEEAGDKVDSPIPSDKGPHAPRKGGCPRIQPDHLRGSSPEAVTPEHLECSISSPKLPLDNSQLLQGTDCSEEREEGLLGVSTAFCYFSPTLPRTLATWFQLQTTTMPGMGPLNHQPAQAL
uniref:Transmembrane protein 115 n=1 Tax=Neovison vison TaxID=452646 RepID=U6CVT7_NEOVI